MMYYQVRILISIESLIWPTNPWRGRTWLDLIIEVPAQAVQVQAVDRDRETCQYQLSRLYKPHNMEETMTLFQWDQDKDWETERWLASIQRVSQLWWAIKIWESRLLCKRLNQNFIEAEGLVKSIDMHDFDFHLFALLNVIYVL